MPDMQPLDYQAPVQRRRPPMRYFAGHAAIWSLVAVVMTVLTFGAASRFEQVFKDMAVAVPPLTLLAFKFFAWMRMGGLLIVWVLPLAVPFVLSRIIPADEAGRPVRSTMLYVRLVTFVALVLVVLLAAYAVIAPLLTIMQSLTGA